MTWDMHRGCPTRCHRVEGQPDRPQTIKASIMRQMEMHLYLVAINEEIELLSLI